MALLKLKFKLGQRLMVGPAGSEVAVTVAAIGAENVWLDIQADVDIPVHREKVFVENYGESRWRPLTAEQLAVKPEHKSTQHDGQLEVDGGPAGVHDVASTLSSEDVAL